MPVLSPPFPFLVQLDTASSDWPEEEGADGPYSAESKRGLRLLLDGRSSQIGRRGQHKSSRQHKIALRAPADARCLSQARRRALADPDETELTEYTECTEYTANPFCPSLLAPPRFDGPTRPLWRQVRTLDPVEADLFLLWPGFGYNCGGNVGDLREVLEKQRGYVDTHYPFWRRVGGADHAFVSVQDRGVQDVPSTLHQAIMVTHFGYRVRGTHVHPRQTHFHLFLTRQQPVIPCCVVSADGDSRHSRRL